LAFADAVHALAAEPSGANVVRYLVASRNLERDLHDRKTVRRVPLREAS
jgi:hypothetical protein